MIRTTTAPTGGVVIGRHWFNRIKAVTATAPGKYLVETYHHGNYTIEGGKKLGGSRTDWFLEDSPLTWTKPIVCRSIIDGLQVVNGM